MAPVGAGKVVPQAEMTQYPRRHSLLPNVEVDEARDLTGEKEALYPLLKTPDPVHEAVEVKKRHGLPPQ